MVNHLAINKIAESKNEYAIWSALLDDYILDVAWNSNDTKIAVATASGKVCVYDVLSGNLLFTVLAHRHGLMSLTKSPVKDVFATTGQDGFIRLFNFESPIPVAEIKSKAQWVSFVRWNHNGKYFASSENSTVRVFTKTGEEINSFTMHESTVSGIEWKLNSNMFATSCYGGVRIFDAEKPEPIDFLEWKNSMLSLSWSPDGKFIGCGTQDSRVHFFPLPYQDGSDFEMNGYRGKVKILEWTTDAKYFLTNCWNEIVIWKFNGKSPQGQTPIILSGSLSKVTQAAFQGNQTFLATGDELGMILFYDVEIGEKFITGVKLKNEISSLKWSNKNNLLAAGTSQGELVIMESPA